MKNKHKPEIRFPGFSGEWEHLKADEIFHSISDKNHANLPVLSASQEKGMVYRAEIGIDIKYDEKSTKNYKRVLPGQFVIHLRSFQGGFAFSSIAGITSPAYTVLDFKNKEKYYSLFWRYVLASDTFIKRLETVTYGIRDGRSISFSDFSTLKFRVPSYNEQIKIGNFLKQLDDTIALQQQELTTLKQTKQGFLQKMFPKEGESVPDVRFPGFTGDWEQRKLDSMVDRLKSYSLSRDVETNDYTGYKYIHYGDIHKKVADIIDESSNLPNIKAGNYELLEKGDLVLADASEDYQGIATPAVITIDMPYNLVSGLHTIALRPKQVDSLFLYYLINSPIFRKYGYRVGTGMKVFGISVTNLLKFESIFPSLEEQTKIGNFFEQLDDTITLHQRELDALKETKKAFLQKMFA
ncbi:restriction endonuclease subunit S [Bacillus cereus]|uniref:restriction endonuclease subunit S n=1 Tax=Bacillus cereus TaxID=1396 RepID=UPI001D0EBAA6|nr:restriction endonuclease subunit S [Bacillus cereus]MCC2364073.1 restriction endonuclease subunit S [Bacillus cereus]